MVDVAKLSLFCSCLPAMTQGWGITMATKKKTTKPTNHIQASCEKMHTEMQRAKSPVKPIIELFTGILIAIVVMRLLPWPNVLRVFLEHELSQRRNFSKVVKLPYNTSFAFALLCAWNKSSHSFLACSIL